MRLTFVDLLYFFTDLNQCRFDMIVNALDNHENRHLLSGQTWYKALTAWANDSRAPVLSIDPPVEGGGSDCRLKRSCVPNLIALGDRSLIL